MTNEQIIHIRELLDRFYRGETTPEEERNLETLLQTEEELPADLIAERHLFASLNPDIPEEISSRIDEALEAEMAGARRVFGSRRDRWLFAGVAAVCLVLVALGINLIRSQQGSELQGGKMQLAEGVSNTDNENMAGVGSLPASDSLIFAPIAQNVESRGSSNASKSVKANKARPSAKMGNGEKTELQEDAISQSEESRDEYYEYIASNYRVIDDPQEAEYLVSQLFASIESNLVIERSRVVDVYDNLQFELTNCCAQMQ